MQIGQVNNGGSATMRFRVRATNTGSFDIKAQVSASAQPDPNSVPDNGYDNPEDDRAGVALSISAGARIGVEEPEEEAQALAMEIQELQLEAFPNPTNGLLQVTISQPQAQTLQLRLIDLLGNTLQEKTTAAQHLNTFFDLSQMNAGMYFILIENAEKRLVKKILKQ
jgi:hypothetical protein